jgi:hypothetical protein
MEHEQKDLEKGEMVLKAGGGDYAPLAEGEPLKMHIGKTSIVETDNYDRTGKETKLVVPFVNDEEGEGNGQVYKKWFTPSLNPKGNLAKLLVALYGEIPAELDPVELEGKPVRVVLTNKERDGVTKQYADTFLKPAQDQKPVDVIVSADEDLDTVKAVFGDDVKSVS